VKSFKLAVLSGIMVVLLYAPAVSVAAETVDVSGQIEIGNSATLSEIYKQAIEHDPKLRASILETQAQIEIKKQSRAAFLPTVSLKVNRTETQQNINSSDNTVFAVSSTRFPTNELTVSLRQPVFHYDSWVGYDQASDNIRKSEVELSAARQDMIIRVIDAYMAVLLGQDDLQRAQAEAGAVESSLRLVKARRSSGQATLADLLEAKARFGSVQAMVIEAKEALANSLNRLQAVSGQRIKRVASLKKGQLLPHPEPWDAEAWEHAAEADNLKVQVQVLVVDVANKEVSRQRAGHYPTIDLVGRYNYRDTKGTLFGGGSKVGTTDVLLEMSVPIFEGGRVYYKTREAEIRHQQAQEDLEELRRSAKQKARSAFSALVSGLARIEALKQAIEAQESVVRLRKQGLRSGLNTNLKVLDAMRDLFFVRRDYAKARYEYLKNTMLLKQASGRLSDEDIAAVNSILGFKRTDS